MSSIRLFCWIHRGSIFSGTVKQEVEILEGLQLMSSIEEISITLASLEGIEKLFSCSKLPRYIRELSLLDCRGLDSQSQHL